MELLVATTIVTVLASYVFVTVVEFSKIFLCKLQCTGHVVTLLNEAVTKQLQWVAGELLRKSAE